MRNADECPERFLSEQSWNVVVTDDLGVHGRLATATDFRRVIKNAPAIWASKGQHDAIVDAIRIFARARSWVGDWHNFVTVAGTSVFPYFATPPISTGGEWVSSVHVEDFDGALDRDLVMDALELVKNTGEDLRVVFVDYVESWENLYRWQNQSSGGVTLGEHYVDLDSSVVSPAFIRTSAGDFSGWDHEIMNSLVRLGAGESISFRCRDDGTDYYEVTLTEGAGPTNVTLNQSGAGLTSGTRAIPVDATVLLTVVVRPVASGDEIEVVVNGTPVINFVDTTPRSEAADRGVSFRASGGDAPRVEWFDAMAYGAETRTLP